MELEIIGSLSGVSRITALMVSDLLNQQAQSLTHGGQFTGKPSMLIHADEALVVKVNESRRFSSESVAYKWCEIQIEIEKQYNVYHPDRTWFVLKADQDWEVGNVTPRLQPLNTLDYQLLPDEQRIWSIMEVLRIYCDFITRHEKRLDEGLSNFGLLDGKVWYLDDDIYPWDRFSSFSAMLANWIRNSAKLSLKESDWIALGVVLQPLLRAYSSSANDIVYEGLTDQLVGLYENYKQSFILALRPEFHSVMVQTASGDFIEHEPIGLIADVHANLPAFEAVLAELEQRGVRQIMMLGDVVGYGPHPRECIELAKQKGVFCIRGNHDHYVAHNGDVRVASSSSAKWTGDWTLDQCSDEEKQWLATLPVRHRKKGWMAVHGSPIDKTFFNGYVYNMTAEKNLDYLRILGVPVCLHGHSHIQGVYALKGRVVLPFMCPEEVNLSDFSASLVCPGSVGQPRDGCLDAQGAILYPDQSRLVMFSTPYDVERVASDMEVFGFPDQVVRRLRAGK